MGLGDSQSDPSTATDAHMAPGQTAVEGDPAFRAVKTRETPTCRVARPCSRAAEQGLCCRVWEGENPRVGEQSSHLTPP